MTSPRPNPDDPTASTATTMIYIFPVMMVLWGSFLPSGLILYYGVLTLILIVQQFILMGWGNLFPLFGWQPKWAPPPDDASPKRLKADEGRGARDNPNGRDDRPQATSDSSSAPGSNRQQPRSGSRRRRGRRR